MTTQKDPPQTFETLSLGHVESFGISSLIPPSAWCENYAIKTQWYKISRIGPENS